LDIEKGFGGDVCAKVSCFWAKWICCHGGIFSYDGRKNKIIQKLFDKEIKL
jgi:hypothetical protein